MGLDPKLFDRLAGGDTASTEKSAQDAIIKYLWSIGAFAIRVNSGAMAGEHKGKKWYVNFNSTPGCSDVLAILRDGRFAAFEVKRPGWKPAGRGERARHEQKQCDFLNEVRRRGGVAGFVTSIDDVRQLLRDRGYEV